MQNATITTTVQRNEVDISADWAAEAVALAQRVNHKIRPPPSVSLPVVADEYEPQDLDQRSEYLTRPSGR